eukprot:6200640-Pleurochrysis_carterae.AAC.1
MAGLLKPAAATMLVGALRTRPAHTSLLICRLARCTSIVPPSSCSLPVAHRPCLVPTHCHPLSAPLTLALDQVVRFDASARCC